MLHYYPWHVSSTDMPIFRKKNCIYTASGTFALCKRVYCAAVYRERRYHMLCEYSFSSWRWACQCPKHVEDNSVTYILLMNKELCIKVGKWNNLQWLYRELVCFVASDMGRKWTFAADSKKWINLRPVTRYEVFASAIRDTNTVITICHISKHPAPQTTGL